MKLLREYFELCEGGICQDLLTEDEKRRVAEGTTILTGVMQMAETKNHNGRVYPMNLLEREVQKYKNLVEQRRALGELDHPESSVINLQNCSHLVTDIWMEGKKVMGKIEVLSTPSGRILETLVKSGVPCGISSRGMGSVREQNGITLVEDDFQLICFDMVSDPSTPGAIMSQVNESKDMSSPLNRVDRVNVLLNDILREK
tara:strand:- start:537 stop:1139 length:603 start_codon:yes stop_codon:yes gene_type:complete